MKHTIFIIAAGLGVSLALFWLMQFMISNNQQGLRIARKEVAPNLLTLPIPAAEAGQ